MIGYVLTSLVYSGCGLIVGFFLGVTYREVHEIRERIVPDRHLGPIPVTNRVLGVAIIILAVLTVTVAAVSTVRESTIVSCQADYNVAFQESQRARADLAERDRRSLTDLLARVGTLLENPDQAAVALEFRAAFDTYEAERAETERQRASVPLPEPPDPDACR